jgi:hypothetical protein
MYSVSQSSLLEQLKADNGIGRALSSHNRCYKIEVENAAAHPQALAFSALLENYRNEDDQIKHLYGYQINAAVNMAYRPNLVRVHTLPNTHHAESVCDATYDYENYGIDDDIGAIALNDLFTGSGKTLVSMLASLEFAQNRKRDVIAKGPLLMREQCTSVMWTDGTGNRRTPKYDNVVLVYSPKHLTGQWQRATGQAIKILGVDAQVVVNPLPAIVDNMLMAFPDGIIVAIYDNVRKVAKRLQFVPCIVVDEFITTGDFNFATRAFQDGSTIIFGRLTVISADAGNVTKILMRLRNACIVKRWAHMTTGSWNYLASIQTMATSSSISTEKRDQISASMGLNTPLIVHTIRYVPTVSGVLFGSAFEISQQSGVQQFRKLGVDVSTCQTTKDILTAIDKRLQQPAVTLRQATVTTIMMDDGTTTTTTQQPPQNQALLVAADRRVREILLVYIHRMNEFINANDVQCPICLDEIKEACILSPCWHITCSECMKIFMRQTRRQCPLCRSNIAGLVTSELPSTVTEDEPQVVQDETPRFGTTISDSIVSFLGPTPGVFKAVLSVLLCLQHHHKNDEEIYRILVAAPNGIDYSQLNQEFMKHVPADKAWLSHFQIIGTAYNRISSAVIESQLATFKSNDGPKLKIMFTSEGTKDAMTGLDLPTVDALVSVGEGNTVQRLGRLTRLGRNFSRGVVHHFAILPVQ